jgi:CO/xanthine dehydrogenase FAD-binding subunit
MNYLIAKSVAEAVNYLDQAQGAALVLAGGTDLMIDLEEHKKQADTLVDVMRISELKDIREEDGCLVIGAAVPLSEIAASPLVRQYFPSLAKGAGSVGSKQIRNAGTLVGNVVTAQPAADAAMALAPLDPEFTVVSAGGSKVMKMGDMYAGFGKSHLNSSKELVTEVRIPLPKANEAAAFIRLELRSNLALPMLNAAVMASVDQGLLNWTRITMGPVGIGPQRASQAEAWFAGKTFDLANIETAAEMALLDAQPRSNPLRGSRKYREQTLPVLIKRAFLDIAEQLSIQP